MSTAIAQEFPRPRWEWLKMKFDGTIGLGSLINLIVMICGGIAVMLSYEHRITAMETGQVQIERRLSDQESQMHTFQGQMDRLVTTIGNSGKRNGNEFTQTPP